MTDERVLSVRNVGKSYRLFGAPQDRLKQMLFRGRRTYFKEFWALRDVSFDVARGAKVGILGRNGAGKSSLLQIIAGVLTPTTGQVQVHGRVAALLELGTGFNMDFSGRENIHINASILGLQQSEIEERLDEIIAFADIGEFIDQPVKTYSSGMFLRLAFAVSIHVDPDILIVDEALAVGDPKFQAKCFRKFQEFGEKGKTILFVSHSTEQIVRHCDRALLFEGGHLIEDGDPKVVSHRYLDLLFGAGQTPSRTVAVAASSVPESSRPASAAAPSVRKKIVATADEPWLEVALKEFANGGQGELFETRPGYNKGEFRWGDGRAKIRDYMIVSEQGRYLNHFDFDQPIAVVIKASFGEDVARPIFGLTIKTPDGVTVYGANSRYFRNGTEFIPRGAGEEAIVVFSFVPRLIAGHYLLSLGIAEERGDEVVPLDRRYDAIEVVVSNPGRGLGLTDLGMDVRMVS